MQKLITPGRIMFALGIIGLGILQFFTKEYVVARPPSPGWSANIPGKTEWAYISGALLIIAGLCIILRKKAEWVSILVGLFILVCSFFLRHLPDMAGDTFWGIVWRINSDKAFVFFGGSLIVAASLFQDQRRNPNQFFTNNVLMTIGWIALSYFLIICGAAHFKFHQFVPSLIPDYIPAHVFWTYFAGVALLAGGVGLIFKPIRTWAAAFSGLMILLWFILLHVPRALATPHVYDEWMGVCESLNFSGILFVLAGLSLKHKSSEAEQESFIKEKVAFT
jgi:uncharacterized membrane protein